MYRLLVVEDQEDFYQEYMLRHFQALLPMEELEIAHVPDLRSACEVLVEPWDAILMDYTLDFGITFLDTPVRDGGDLVAFRRAVERKKQLSPALILGTSSNFVGNSLMVERGADGYYSKLDVERMAKRIRSDLSNQAKAPKKATS